MKRRKILAAASSLAVLAALLTGCGAQPQEGSVTAGVLTLRVNPEIAIHYNQSGKVVAPTTSARTAKWWSRSWWRKSTQPVTL